MIIVRRSPSTDFSAVEICESTEPRVKVVIESQFGDMTYYETDTVGGKVVLDLQDFSAYDATLLVSIHTVGGDLLYFDQVAIIRPYVEPGPGVVDKEAFYEQALVAQVIIDAYVGGFYLTRRTFAMESFGGDALTLRDSIYRILRAWENGTLVFDATDPSFVNRREFVISPDRSMVYIDGQTNRTYGNDPTLDWAPSDYLSHGGSLSRSRAYRRGTFGVGRDFVFDAEVGYKVIPFEIMQAAKMLMDSGACADKYLDRNIIEYDTDQYRLKYASVALESTGNRKVDMILQAFVAKTGRIRAAVI